MPVGAAIAAGGSLLSAGITSGAAQTAAQAQQQASANNLAFEKQVYNTGQQQLTPTINEGTAAGSALSGLLDTGGNTAQSQADFQQYLNSTNYQFQLGQGENAVEYANAPAFSSGATAKALNNYAQGQAGSALQGYEGLLQGQQSLGAQSALGLAGVGNQNAAIQAQQNNLAAGATGNAALTGASAYGSALSGLNSIYNQYATQSSFGNNSALGTLGSSGGPLTGLSGGTGGLIGG